jgi:hypothetical protein
VDEDCKPWERMDGEPNRWFQRFEIYRLAGPNRTLLGTVNAEKAQRGIQRHAKQPSGAWKRRFEEFNWKARAEAWDQYISYKIAAEAEEKALSSGYALRFKRVESLNQLAELLLDELFTEDKRWLPDVKQIGGGEFAERVDIVRFNSPLIEQFRKTLDDLAAEMGERVKGIAAQNLNLDLSNLTNEQLERIANGEDPIRVLATPGAGRAGETPAD